MLFFRSAAKWFCPRRRSAGRRALRAAIVNHRPFARDIDVIVLQAQEASRAVADRATDGQSPAASALGDCRPRLEALGLIVAAGPQVLVSDVGAVSDSVDFNRSRVKPPFGSRPIRPESALPFATTARSF